MVTTTFWGLWDEDVQSPRREINLQSLMGVQEGHSKQKRYKY